MSVPYPCQHRMHGWFWSSCAASRRHSAAGTGTAQPTQPSEVELFQCVHCMAWCATEEACWCSGIFVGGASPLWLIAHRGTLIPHPCEADGPVVGFTAFHNPSCPHVSPMLKFPECDTKGCLTTAWYDVVSFAWYPVEKTGCVGRTGTRRRSYLTSLPHVDVIALL